ncbi:MAG: sialidase family protein [Armatimonadota bacterium]|nr:sialidase family protein [Armatimonadota bacterium]
MRVLSRLEVTNPLPTAFCHGATLLPVGDRLLAAWFGGTREGEPDASVYLARLEPQRGVWSAPELVAPADGQPCGNPVLFEGHAGVLWLVYFRVDGRWCVDGRPHARVSFDGGHTWSPEVRLLDRPGVLTKNKPIRVGEELLLPVYDERAWTVGVARLRGPEHHMDWEFDELTVGAGTGVPMIQGTLVEVGSGELLMLMRTKEGRIWGCRSRDAGRTWSDPAPTSLPNPNAGVDAVRLPDGRLWLVYNHTDRGRDPMVWEWRYPLSLAESRDGGATWTRVWDLEAGPGEYSYPAVVVDSQGRVHVAYTALRQAIRHVVLDPEGKPGQPILGGKGPM